MELYKAKNNNVVNIDNSEGAKNFVAFNSVSVKEPTSLLQVGSTYQSVVSITPLNATNKNIEWSSTNNYVATVNSKGLVTATGRGKVYIIAKTEDGNLTA